MNCILLVTAMVVTFCVLYRPTRKWHAINRALQTLDRMGRK